MKIEAGVIQFLFYHYVFDAYVDFFVIIWYNRHCVKHYVSVAQLDRVFGYEPKGRGFESLQTHHFKF